MKNILSIILITIILFAGCRAKKPGPVPPGQREIQDPSAKYSDQSTWLLGYFDPAQLLRPPHSEWYQSGFDKYAPGEEAMSRLMTVYKEDLSITIVMGTWCPDSRREVPKFMRILDIWKFPAGNVTFIGVDNMKIAPVGGFDTLNIERVPTFIFYKNKVEAGRIIENPETSLEQDMVNILMRNEN